MTRDEMRDELYDYMLNNEIATERELHVAIWLEGFTLETMNSMLFCLTGYRDLEQYREAMEEEEE